MAKKKEKTLAEKIKSALSHADALYNETDRGCALVAAAWIGEQLEKLLLACFERDSPGATKAHSRLLGGSSSLLFNDGAKNAACRAFGLIDQATFDAIETLLAIRSKKFAHHAGSKDFGDQDVRDLVDNLTATLGDLFLAVFDDWKKGDPKVLENLSEYRRRFMSAYTAIDIRLDEAQYSVLQVITPL